MRQSRRKLSKNEIYPLGVITGRLLQKREFDSYGVASGPGCTLILHRP
jgi:hypothetical protein